MARRSSILALIAAAAVGVAAGSATASAKEGQSAVHNGAPSYKSSGPSQSGGSSSHMTTVYRDHDRDHEHDYEHHHDHYHYYDHHHDNDHDHDHAWHDKWWYHHDHDRYYDHDEDRYVPQQVRPYVVRPVVADPSPPANCLTKEYLEPDTVLFKDVCTKQWAKNSTSVSMRVASADAKCLTKEKLQGGAVLFKDLCTSEWAMSAPDQAVPR